MLGGSFSDYCSTQQKDCNRCLFNLSLQNACWKWKWPNAGTGFLEKVVSAPRLAAVRRHLNRALGDVLYLLLSPEVLGWLQKRIKMGNQKKNAKNKRAKKKFEGPKGKTKGQQRHEEKQRLAGKMLAIYTSAEPLWGVTGNLGGWRAFRSHTCGGCMLEEPVVAQPTNRCRTMSLFRAGSIWSRFQLRILHKASRLVRVAVLLHTVRGFASKPRHNGVPACSRRAKPYLKALLLSRA